MLDHFGDCVGHDAGRCGPVPGARCSARHSTVSFQAPSYVERLILSCPSIQGSLTKLREGPSIVSSKVRNIPGGQIWFMLTGSCHKYEEQSLEETKDVARRKLGLERDAPIELVQLRDGRRIDLEDGACLQ